MRNCNLNPLKNGDKWNILFSEFKFSENIDLESIEMGLDLASSVNKVMVRKYKVDQNGEGYISQWIETDRQILSIDFMSLHITLRIH